MVFNRKTWMSVATIAVIGSMVVGCGGSSSKKATAKKKTTTTTTAPAPTAASTIIAVQGVLNLLNSSSSSSLTTGEAYWVKCVTLDLTNASACIDGVDATTGEFNLSCDGFKGKRFGCFILAGADEASLEIVGMVSSSQLAMAADTSKAAMAINFNPETGAAEVASLEQVKTNAAGAEVEVSADEVAAAAEAAPFVLPDVLKNLAVPVGEYEFSQCNVDPVAQAAAIKSGTVDATCFDATQTNKGMFREIQYVHFTAGSETTKVNPFLEVWKKEQDRSACMPNDVLTYHISDGTNTVTFPASTPPTMDDLYAKIEAGGWMPKILRDSIDLRAQGQMSSDGGKKDGPSEFFGTDFCVDNAESKISKGATPIGMMTWILDAYTGAKIDMVGGKKQCTPASLTSACNTAWAGYTFDPSMTTEVKNMLQSEICTKMFATPGKDGPPAEWCTEWKASPTAAVKAKFVSDCQSSDKQENDGDYAKANAKRQVVDQFLWMLAEQKYQNNQNSRFDGLQNAYKLVKLYDTSGNLYGQDAFYAANGADQIKALVKELSDAYWDGYRKEQFKKVITNYDSTSAVQGLNTKDGENAWTDKNAKTFLFWFLTSTTWGWGGPGDSEGPKGEIERMLCESSQYDFNGINSSTQTAADNILDNMAGSDWNVAVKTGAHGGTLLSGFYTPALNDPAVQGCTRVKLKSNQAQMLNSCPADGATKPDGMGGTTPFYPNYMGNCQWPEGGGAPTAGNGCTAVTNQVDCSDQFAQWQIRDIYMKLKDTKRNIMYKTVADSLLDPNADTVKAIAVDKATVTLADLTEDRDALVLSAKSVFLDRPTEGWLFSSACMAKSDAATPTAEVLSWDFPYLEQNCTANGCEAPTEFSLRLSCKVSYNSNAGENQSPWVVSMSLFNVGTSAFLVQDYVNGVSQPSALTGVPQQLNNIFNSGSGWLPQDSTTDTKQNMRNRLASLTETMFSKVSNEAQRFDMTFAAAKQAIFANSQCLPDARVSNSPISGEGVPNFALSVSSPVKRKLAGEVKQFVTPAGVATDNFEIIDARVVQEKGGMSGDGGCFHGEVQKLRNVAAGTATVSVAAYDQYGKRTDTDASTFKLEGIFQQKYVDTCRSGGSEDSGSGGGNNGMTTMFRATKVNVD